MYVTTSQPSSSRPRARGAASKPAAARWSSSACTAGVHAPLGRRTVSPTRTTDSCVLPPPSCSLLLAGNVVVAVLAVAQEARELGGDRIARRQVGLLRDLVGTTLELGDVGRRLLVGGHRFAPLLLVGVRSLVKLGGIDIRLEQLRKPIDERLRRARRRRQRHVV